MDFGARNQDEDQVVFIDSGHRAIFGRSYAAEPDKLTRQLKAEDSDGMHRVDLAGAAGRPLLPGAHDRVITAQVIADLAQAWHGPPVLPELTGPAGGRWTLGHGRPAATVQADAVDYLRALSGRNDHPDLQINGDPTAAAAVTTARVVF